MNGKDIKDAYIGEKRKQIREGNKAESVNPWPVHMSSLHTLSRRISGNVLTWIGQ